MCSLQQKLELSFNHSALAEPSPWIDLSISLEFCLPVFVPFPYFTVVWFRHKVINSILPTAKYLHRRSFDVSCFGQSFTPFSLVLFGPIAGISQSVLKIEKIRGLLRVKPCIVAGILNFIFETVGFRWHTDIDSCL